MKLEQRINLLVRLGAYIRQADEEWQAVKRRAHHENNWFIAPFVDLAAANIADRFLQPALLESLAERYGLRTAAPAARQVGIVLAGNIPLVGFHDVLCCFMSGHHALIKPSSKDDLLIRHLVGKLVEWDPAAAPYLQFGVLLKGCDAYIATGGNNTARYFEYYFRNHPSIIRKNRTSVALLAGNETPEQLDRLADDIHQYFGLGCRNVTKLYVPAGYDFVPLLNAFNRYSYFMDHHKYKNNYDYNLAIHLLNHKYYMTNGSTLLIEEAALFSPISQVNYTYYTDPGAVHQALLKNEQVQCIVGSGFLPFGQAQCPNLTDFADGVDTMEFFSRLGAAPPEKEVRRS